MHKWVQFGTSFKKRVCQFFCRKFFKTTFFEKKLFFCFFVGFILKSVNFLLVYSKTHYALQYFSLVFYLSSTRMGLPRCMCWTRPRCGWWTCRWWRKRTRWSPTSGETQTAYQIQVRYNGGDLEFLWLIRFRGKNNFMEWALWSMKFQSGTIWPTIDTSE